MRPCLHRCSVWLVTLAQIAPGAAFPRSLRLHLRHRPLPHRQRLVFTQAHTSNLKKSDAMPRLTLYNFDFLYLWFDYVNTVGQSGASNGWVGSDEPTYCCRSCAASPHASAAVRYSRPRQTAYDDGICGRPVPLLQRFRGRPRVVLCSCVRPRAHFWCRKITFKFTSNHIFFSSSENRFSFSCRGLGRRPCTCTIKAT